jgi:dienelactone hydrolase
MTATILYHSALGLRPSVLADAERLRASGHPTSTPDLYDGESFDDLPSGLAKRDAIGVPELIRRSLEAAAREPAASAFAGYSLGGTLAALGACHSEQASRLVLISEAVSATDLEVAPWPARLDVQVHYAEGDRWIDVAALDDLERAVEDSGARLESFTYASDAHFFFDNSQPGYDAGATEVMWSRVLTFLSAAR